MAYDHFLKRLFFLSVSVYFLLCGCGSKPKIERLNSDVNLSEKAITAKDSITDSAARESIYIGIVPEVPDPWKKIQLDSWMQIKFTLVESSQPEDSIIIEQNTFQFDGKKITFTNKYQYSPGVTKEDYQRKELSFSEVEYTGKNEILFNSSNHTENVHAFDVYRVESFHVGTVKYCVCRAGNRGCVGSFCRVYAAHIFISTQGQLHHYVIDGYGEIGLPNNAFNADTNNDGIPEFIESDGPENMDSIAIATTNFYNMNPDKQSLELASTKRAKIRNLGGPSNYRILQWLP